VGGYGRALRIGNRQDVQHVPDALPASFVYLPNDFDLLFRIGLLAICSKSSFCNAIANVGFVTLRATPLAPSMNILTKTERFEQN